MTIWVLFPLSSGAQAKPGGLYTPHPCGPSHHPCVPIIGRRCTESPLCQPMTGGNNLYASIMNFDANKRNTYHHIHQSHHSSYVFHSKPWGVYWGIDVFCRIRRRTPYNCHLFSTHKIWGSTLLHIKFMILSPKWTIFPTIINNNLFSNRIKIVCVHSDISPHHWSFLHRQCPQQMQHIL